MSESTATAEKLQEASKVLERMRAISDLCMDAQSDVLKASSVESVKEALFKYAFFALAHANIVPNHSRLRDRDTDEIEEYGEDLVATKEMYDKILKGDWVEVKRCTFVDLLNGDILASADRFGLDKDFKYNGVNIFLKEVGNPPRDVGQAQEDYIREKLSLLPDKTEPYIYPRMEELKRRVEISS